MPYRRLPNTDTARIKALKTALALGKEIPPFKLAFSGKTLVAIQKLLSQYENYLSVYRQSTGKQTNSTKEYQETMKKARTYLSHFIRVMNMAILRGELPPETRTYFGFTLDESTVPLINTENELVTWGKRIIDGEEFRIRKGKTPITNPSIAVVKVRYEQFMDALNFHNTSIKRNQDQAEKVAEMRTKADSVIQTLWNEVESHFEKLPEEKRRLACEEYGLIYVFRKGEFA